MESLWPGRLRRRLRASEELPESCRTYCPLGPSMNWASQKLLEEGLKSRAMLSRHCALMAAIEGRDQYRDPAPGAFVRRPALVKFIQAVSPDQRGFLVRRESEIEVDWPCRLFKMRQNRSVRTLRNKVQFIRRIRISFVGFYLS